MKETEACKNMEIGNLRLMCSDLGKVSIPAPFSGSKILSRKEPVSKLIGLESGLTRNETILKVAGLKSDRSQKWSISEVTDLENDRFRLKNGCIVKPAVWSALTHK